MFVKNKHLLKVHILQHTRKGQTEIQKKNNYQPLTLSQKANTPCEYHVFNLFWGRERGVGSGRIAPKTFCVVLSLTTFCVVNN